MFGSILGLLVAFSLGVSAWEPDYILRVSNQTIYSDCQPRSSVVINGMSVLNQEEKARNDGSSV